MHHLPFFTIIILLAGFSTIIRRHDVADHRYVELANSLPVTSSIIKYSSTDVAGTLISPRWILSAAHVAETISEEQTLLGPAGEALKIERIIIHPGWLEDGSTQDIALIELRSEVHLESFPVVYADLDELDQEVIIIGHGDNGTGITGPVGNDGKMRAATNRVDEVSTNYLKWGFEHPDLSSGRMTDLEGISGPGDSSGPAFLEKEGKYYLVGISSGQSTRATNGEEGKYGVTEYYTRVSSYTDWINSMLAP